MRICKSNYYNEVMPQCMLFFFYCKCICIKRNRVYWGLTLKAMSVWICDWCSPVGSWSFIRPSPSHSLLASSVAQPLNLCVLPLCLDFFGGTVLLGSSTPSWHLPWLMRDFNSSTHQSRGLQFPFDTSVSFVLPFAISGRKSCPSLTHIIINCSNFFQRVQIYIYILSGCNYIQCHISLNKKKIYFIIIDII